MNRRTFLQSSAAAYLLRSVKLDGARARPAEITKTAGSVRAKGAEYTWEWSPASDEFQLLDKWGLEIASGKLQPAVVVQPSGQKGRRQCSAGKPAGAEIRGNRVTVRYEGVNGNSILTSTWSFDDHVFWSEPVAYETTSAEDVVDFYSFAQGTGEGARPTLGSNFLVTPGATESGEMSPVILADEQPLRTSTLANWLGRGSFPGPGTFQQWGLPVHYFCGFHRSPYDYQKVPAIDFKGAAPDELLGAFCCGLAELPEADMFIESAGGRFSPLFSYRSDLWGHLRGPGRLNLGAKLCWTVAGNYYESIRRYYLRLAEAGIIHKKINSSRKNRLALSPSFDTWGAQVSLDPINDLWGQIPDRFDEAGLNMIYDGLKASGIKVKMFVIDGYWEDKYGDLEPSPTRFPNFETMLDRMRSEGYYIGLWSAFMRCQDPAKLGLTTAHMLRLPDGNPFVIRGDPTGKGNPFYILDFTQPEAARVIQDLARKFVRRFKPDFVKFDFGYELPPLAVAAPKDMRFAGERLLLKGMEVVVKAMREVNPDIVVLYYSFSPLFIDYFDLYSPDDMGLAMPDYDIEANRRLFFGSLLGEIGMPTWGSGGYDWLTAPEVWFDSVALGTLGSLGSFAGPDPQALATPERVAKYNGLTQAIRYSNVFSPIPLDVAYHGPIRGGHAYSWARIENGEVVLVALRQQRLDGLKGAGKFRDIVSANATVVVSSKTDMGLARSNHLAVIPFGDGELSLKREENSADYAEVTEHYFRGDKNMSRLRITNGLLRVPLRERSTGGSLVEWIEVVIPPA